MTARFGLKEKTIKKICTVFSAYPQVDKVVIYGSRAKGNYQTGSDIDLTIFGAEDLTYKILTHISSEIDDLLLPYTFDVSIFRHISDPDLINHIERVGLVFYEKQSEFIEI